MRRYEDWHFAIDGVPFIIRRTGSTTIHRVGHFVLFQNGRFRCRGTKKLCVAWAKHFAKVTDEI